MNSIVQVSIVVMVCCLGPMSCGPKLVLRVGRPVSRHGTRLIEPQASLTLRRAALESSSTVTKVSDERDDRVTLVRPRFGGRSDSASGLGRQTTRPRQDQRRPPDLARRPLLESAGLVLAFPPAASRKRRRVATERRQPFTAQSLAGHRCHAPSDRLKRSSRTAVGAGPGYGGRAADPAGDREAGYRLDRVTTPLTASTAILRSPNRRIAESKGGNLVGRPDRGVSRETPCSASLGGRQQPVPEGHSVTRRESSRPVLVIGAEQRSTSVGPRSIELRARRIPVLRATRTRPSLPCGPQRFAPEQDIPSTSARCPPTRVSP